jgi:multicomponent Na+:H+ antiporter subunit D
MPVTAFAFWIAAFSIAGVPLFNGYVSKSMVLVAAEEVSPVLWVLLEIASFGTFLSFLKLGYFAFLRPAKNEIREASDPPLIAQIAMAGTAALCVAIGVYPPLLYAMLPDPVTYPVYNPIQLAGAAIVLGAAALFFFTVGIRLLEPHDTRLRDADVLYVAAARGVVAIAGGVQMLFGAVYEGARGGAVTALSSAGEAATRTDVWDVNWSLAGIALGALALLIAFLAVNGQGILP